MSELELTESIKTEPGIRISGTAKWFDTVKGYGFIVPLQSDGPMPNTDIMLHVSCLRDFGETMIDEGAHITCRVVRREKGWQVLDIEDMDRPRLSPQAEEPLVFETVIVKWFNIAKGFGFVNRPENSEDIFLHISVLRKVGIESVDTGQILYAIISKGQKGLNVVSVRPVEL